MDYTIVWTETSRKKIEKLPRDEAERIIAAVESIKNDPFRYIDRLTGSPWYTYRTGKFRVILDIRRQTLIVFVLKVGQRKNVYRDL